MIKISELNEARDLVRNLQRLRSSRAQPNQFIAVGGGIIAFQLTSDEINQHILPLYDNRISDALAGLSNLGVAEG